MKVTNQTNKTIKFHNDKFVYTIPENKILSSGNGTLTVKPRTSKNIDQLFDDVPEQGILGDGVIEYLNSNNKLTYSKLGNNVATSANLKNPRLSKHNASPENSSEDGSNTTASSSATTPQSNAALNAKVAASSSPSGTPDVHLTQAQAAQKLQNWANSIGDDSMDVNTLTPTQGSGGYGFNEDDGLTWSVAYDGTIHAPGDPVQ